MKAYRLDRFEVLNWGTFHKRIWSIEAKCANILVTGDNGSGKSTLIDGLATLLVRPQRLHYNLAGGASAKERSKQTYVLGHWKSETAGDQTASPGRSKPVSLRGPNQQSVLLAVFRSDEDAVTLAQVFWCSDYTSPPHQLFLVAEGALGIDGAFTGIADPTALRKRLKELPGAEVSDSFVSYGEIFRRRLGIDSEQALDLFAKTMAMKDVENLTTFVRGSMLDETMKVDDLITGMVGQFDSLKEAHRKVVEARQQIEALLPLSEITAEFDRLQGRIAAGKVQLEELPVWIASRRVRLRAEKLARLDVDVAALREAIITGDAEHARMNLEKEALFQELGQKGGDRVGQVEAVIGQLEIELQRRSTARSQFTAWISLIGLTMPDSIDAFHELETLLAERRKAVADQQNELTNKNSDLREDLKRHQAELRRLRDEIGSLKTRTNRIDSLRIQRRFELCRDLDIDPERLPFGGELVRVKESEGDWLGAIERALRGFADTLLIPTDLHDQVTAWINRTNLGIRLHLNRFDTQAGPRLNPKVGGLVSKVEVREGPANRWVMNELVRRHDLWCVETSEEANRRGGAITPSGYLAYDGNRSVKDDRPEMSNPRNFRLGWSNQDLIATLEKDAGIEEERLCVCSAQLTKIQHHLDAVRNNQVALAQITSVSAYADIDQDTTARELLARQEELRQLRSATDPAALIRSRIDLLKGDMTRLEGKLRERRANETNLTTEIRGMRKDLEADEHQVAAATDVRREQVWPALELRAGSLLAERGGSLTGLGYVETHISRQIQGESAADNQGLVDTTAKMVGCMSAFRGKWQAKVQDLDDSPGAASGFLLLLKVLQDDDLPSYEGDFRNRLREQTTNGVALLNSTLNNHQLSVAKRIDNINDSLKPVTFRDNPTTYIQLVPTEAYDQDVRAFREEMRNCTQGSITGTEDESTPEEIEAKFITISGLIDRLRMTTDADRRWREKVTDVRRWFEFGASERRREDHLEVEHYSDSNGKSGGQKENLAYTMLAAGLAYQYRVHDPERKRGFRFVIIDEAFGRASDKITDFGLRLFHGLGLQLLIATPIQKVHAIEPHVSSVSFVHIEDRKDSRVRNMTIQQMRDERQAHRNPKSGADSQSE